MAFHPGSGPAATHHTHHTGSLPSGVSQPSFGSYAFGSRPTSPMNGGLMHPPMGPPVVAMADGANGGGSGGAAGGGGAPATLSNEGQAPGRAKLLR